MKHIKEKTKDISEQQNGESLSEIAKREIERMIVFGELKVHVLYSENKIASMLNLGRTPVREALQTLEQLHLLKVHQRKGIEILEVSAQEQLQLLEVRRHIEPICIKFAVMRATPCQKKQMLMLGNKLNESAVKKEEEVFLQILHDIHKLLCEATQNPFFYTSLREIQYSSRRFWFANKHEDDEVKAAQMHNNILKNIVIGNEKKALMFSNELIEHLVEVCYTKI